MPNGKFTLLEALMQAGGYKQEADLSVVILARENGEGVRQSWLIDMAPILTAKIPPQPVYLLPGDVILVPDRPIVQVTRWIDEYINKFIPGGAQGLLTLFIIRR